MPYPVEADEGAGLEGVSAIKGVVVVAPGSLVAPHPEVTRLLLGAGLIAGLCLPHSGLLHHLHGHATSHLGHKRVDAPKLMAAHCSCMAYWHATRAASCCHVDNVHFMSSPTPTAWGSSQSRLQHAPHAHTSLSLGWAATQRSLSKPCTLTISLRCCRGTPVSGSLVTAAASLQQPVQSMRTCIFVMLWGQLPLFEVARMSMIGPSVIVTRCRLHAAGGRSLLLTCA